MALGFFPATKAMPKEMMPINNKPLIEYGVEEALHAGLNEICIVTGRGKRAIEDHFDINFELERQIAGSDEEKHLHDTRHLIDQCRFSYTRQVIMKGLGHAILAGEILIGQHPFAVILADDLCINFPDTGAMTQMVHLYQQYRCSIIAVQNVSDDEVDKYGIINGNQLNDTLVQVTDMVEKPALSETSSRMAIIGRYILTPDIFDHLRQTPPGKGGEIQLTDALLQQVKNGRVLAYQFQGKRFDCGRVPGFVAATSYCYKHQYNN